MTNHKAEPAYIPPRSSIVARYPYHNEHGSVFYIKERYDGQKGKKSFGFVSLDSNGNLQTGMGQNKPLLYRLPEVLLALKEKKTIYLVEGEKDADTLHNHKLVATTAHSTLYWDDTYTDILNNTDVVVVYDYDKTGIKRRDKLCDKLFGNVRRLRVVELPGLEYRESHGQDITDWLDMDAHDAS